MAGVKPQILNWLYSVLTSEYKDVNRTYNDVAQTLSRNPTLLPRTEVYTYENGRSALLLQLSGTIPVLFRGTTYRFPITLWVPHRYPLEAPMLYVTPTEGMMIRPGQHVDPQGKIYHPYLVGWAEYWDKSNVLDFLAILRDVFAKEPPVISRQQQNPPPQQQAVLTPPPIPPPPPNITRPVSIASDATMTPSRSIPVQPPPPPPKPGAVSTQQPMAGPSRRDSGPPLPPLPPQHTREGSRYGQQVQQPAQASQYASPQRIKSLRYESAPPLPPQPPRQPSSRDPPYSPVSPISPVGSPFQHAQYTQTYQQNSPQLNQNIQSQQSQQPRPPSYMPQPGQFQPQPHQQPQQWQQYPPQTQPPPPPQQKPPPPPIDLLDAPLVLSIPTQESANLPAPPIPPNPEKDILLHNLGQALQSQRAHTLAQTTSSLPGLEAQHTAMLTSLQRMNAEIQALESLNALLTSNTNILHTALHDADAVIESSQHRKPPNIDELLVAPTVVANQLYELVSEERSLGDALFVLGRAVEKGRIEPAVFAKMTRSLAREWFLKKALVKKIGKGMALATY